MDGQYPRRDGTRRVGGWHAPSRGDVVAFASAVGIRMYIGASHDGTHVDHFFASHLSLIELCYRVSKSSQSQVKSATLLPLPEATRSLLIHCHAKRRNRDRTSPTTWPWSME